MGGIRAHMPIKPGHQTDGPVDTQKHSVEIVVGTN